MVRVATSSRVSSTTSALTACPTGSGVASSRRRGFGAWPSPAASAPTPVSERTSSSSYWRSLPRSVDSFVPRKQPRNPIGMQKIAGLSRASEPSGDVAPGHTGLDRMISTVDEIRPLSMPTIAPMVLNSRHHSASSSAGNVTLEAKQNARPTSTETLNSAPPTSASAIASTPIAIAAIFATQTSSFSESRPLRTTLDHTSCATAPDAEITSPATTARIVASATAEMIGQEDVAARGALCRRRGARASSGIARLPVSPAALPSAGVRIARAPTPTNMTIR